MLRRSCYLTVSVPLCTAGLARQDETAAVCITRRQLHTAKCDQETDGRKVLAREGANKQVISSQADSLIKISRIWADFFSRKHIESAYLGVSLEIGNFCTLSTLFNQFGYVSD